MLEERKSEHLHINLDKDVSFPLLTSGLERYRFVHNALPEVALDEVDLQTMFLGRTLRLPLLISSMTGGTSEAQRINRHLAEGAQAAGIAMGLGSLRAAIEAPHLVDTFRVRDLAPDVVGQRDADRVLVVLADLQRAAVAERPEQDVAGKCVERIRHGPARLAREPDRVLP